MDSRREQEILDLVTRLREKSDALIVVGIMPGGRIFKSVDPRLTIPDLHGVLQDNIDFICESEARRRARHNQKGTER